jgi:hypothetical protein
LLLRQAMQRFSGGLATALDAMPASRKMRALIHP